MTDTMYGHSPVPQPLAERSLLHDRYIVGPVAGKPAEYIINYIGFDKQSKQKVVIRELFPAQLCARARDGKSIEIPGVDNRMSFQTISDKFKYQARQYPIVPHPAIHSGVDVFDENGTSYQITDYVTGTALPEYLAQSGRRLSEHEALQLFLPLLDGIQQMHDFGLHHGYISPATIRVVKTQTEFRLVLMNLGIPPKAESKNIPGYTAPGAAAGISSADKLMDIYAIAATLYTAVTGAKPPDAADRVQNPALPLLSNPEFALSDKIKSGILAGLAINPAERVQTAMNLKFAILGESEDSLLPDAGILEADESLFEGVEAGPIAPAGSSSRSSKNTKLVIGLILGTLLVILVPGWFLILSPMLDVKNAAEHMFDDMATEMGTATNQEQVPVTTEEPTLLDESQMTQREIEVERLLTQADGMITMGNIDEGIETIKKASQMTPNAPKVHLALGQAYVKANKTREAIQSFEKVVRLDESNGEAYGSLGFIYYDSQRQAKAYDHFRKAASLGDPVTISFLQSEANKGNSTAQNVLRDNGINW